MRLYLFAIREHATEQQRDEIEMALETPLDLIGPDGTPAWYGSDDAAWDDWEQTFGAGQRIG